MQRSNIEAMYAKVIAAEINRQSGEMEQIFSWGGLVFLTRKNSGID